MEEKLYKIFSDVFELDISKINDSISMDSLGQWDSIMHLVLMAEIEYHFNIPFSPDSIGEIHSLRDALDKLKQHQVT